METTVTLFDKELGLGTEKFSQFESYGLQYVDVVNGEVYAGSDYDLPADFDNYVLSLVK